jgi:tripartite-type tricarboxylate transporter receptor subunit TctC
MTVVIVGVEQREETAMAQSLPRGIVRALCLIAAIALIAQPARAQSVAQFYHGKTIDMIVGFAPGGGNDVAVRAVGRYIGKYIPGNPTVVVRNMPGAGTFLATNAVYNTLPRDGTVMALGSTTLPLDEKFGNPGVRFKTAELDWIGRIAARVDVLMMWKTSPVQSIEQALTTPSILAGTTVGSPVVMYPNLLNNVIGTKFKIVRGYDGTRAALLAMEKGEANGNSTGFEALRAIHPDWIKDGTVRIIVQFALKRDPALPDVPAAVELGRTPEQTAILKAVLNSTAIGLAMFTTPGVPPDRLAALRRAFDATMADPEFVAELQKQGGDVSPLPGEQLQQVVRDVADLPPDLIAKAKAAYLKVE